MGDRPMQIQYIIFSEYIYVYIYIYYYCSVTILSRDRWGHGRRRRWGRGDPRDHFDLHRGMEEGEREGPSRTPLSIII